MPLEVLSSIKLLVHRYLRQKVLHLNMTKFANLFLLSKAPCKRRHSEKIE